ncbi:EAL domain-containing protein [Undibacterium arcticum]|uniref:EAL domain-containing protein n=1 Tax=Undibacterium arcticum TaxID=1762892 RepID=UPI003624396A
MFYDYFRRTGFRRQLMVIVTASILGLALFSSLMNSWETSRAMRGYLIEQGQHIAENLARQSTLALLYHSPDNVREGVATTLAFPDVLQVEITDAGHKVLLSETKAGTIIQPNRRLQPDVALTHAMLAGETGDEWRFGAPVYEGQAGASPFDLQEHKPELLGYVHVVLGKGSMNRLVVSLLLGNLAITLSFAIILLGVIRLLAQHLIRPLNALSGLMGRAEAGESGMRAVPGGPRDIIDMAHAFNKMMTVLEEREAELKQARDQALHMALMKAQFAATVSHEVRTPLNGVIGMLDLLKEMPLTPPQQECVEVARSSAHTLMDLINNILDFSKVEAGKVELEEIDFDLRKLLDEVIELLAGQVQQKGLELGYLLSSGVPDRIKGDSLRLRQVLLNLIGNAVKFTEHGEVAVRISCTADSFDRISLRFEVSDTGIGMDQDTARHVFESFSQADRSTTRKYGGTGLGLTISKQLAELMGGEIGVVSQLGQGTTFWLTILCKPGELRPFVPEQQTLTGLRVLVMAESEIVRSFLTQNLTDHGMSCRATGSTAETLLELGRAEQNQTPYFLVIMDLSASDGQGADLARHIHSHAALSATRLLLLDRYGAPQSELPVGADGYLGKPLRLNRLLDAIRHLLSDGETRSIAATPPTLPAGPTTAAGTYQVLVVEDNRTNQVVAGGMLAMSGCHCEFASNGWEAIEATRRSRFDLILMDCNMPEMDGYEVTAQIRNIEEPQGRRTPIVAMTANTQPGDLEKCLAAGMDDYLAKPITLVALRHKLECWFAKGMATKQTVEEIPNPVAVKDGVLDRVVFDKLREILGPALQHAVRPFLEDVPAYLEQLEQAVCQRDAEAAGAAAHTIKGCSSNLGATSLTLCAKAVEDLALKQQIDDIRLLLPQLRSAFDEVAVLLGSEVFLENQRPIKPEEASILVLVVDDDRSTRSALRHTLSRDGFRVEEAENGAQALMLLKRIQPDVILMDALMPVMDGFTTCARLQEHPNGHAIPVLMITALEDNLSVERAFAAGASDYIPKPIHFAVLSQRVRRIVDANRTEQRIRHLAYNDPLTDLPNRALFFKQLERCIEQARQTGEMVAVLFLDLDRFKNVNDTLGHEVGDRLLVAVAQRIRRSVRSVDCVARLGGDEFTVVLADMTGPNTAAAAAQNICRALSTPFQIDGHDIFVSTSIGISLYPHDSIDAVALLKHADTAMYRAKKARSGFTFEAAMELAVSEHMRLESDLREALNRQELEVYYQPQARLDNGLVVGMEALLRWHHPTRGPVSPAEFIPVAEETGLINPIGEWVLRTACTQLQTWLKSGMPPMRMAVNLSVRQLLQEDFSATVAQVLADTGLSPQLLELEITESTLMDNAQDTLQALQRLRSLDVRLSIDDFGTGYSSLAYLKRFPVNTIKIDQYFVRDVPHDADDAAIIKGIITLAHGLRLEVVAEGVETEAQLRFLRDQSCDLMQGYLLSKPVPAQQFAHFIMSQTRLRQEDIPNPDIS